MFQAKKNSYVSLQLEYLIKALLLSADLEKTPLIYREIFFENKYVSTLLSIALSESSIQTSQFYCRFFFPVFT